MRTEDNCPLAVVYARVSSKKQVSEGHGLSSQDTRCREHAAYRGYDVVATFTDDITGSSTLRKGMTEMLAFLRKHRGKKPIVIIDDISRLGRSRSAYWELRGAITDVGAVLESPNTTFGDDAESDFREGISVEFAQLERRKNADRTKHRMRSRAMNGYYVLSAPKGYRYERVAGHGKMLVPHEPFASIVKEALEGYASGRFETLVEVKRFLERQPAWPKDKKGEVPQERVTEIFSRPIYAGHITIENFDLHLVPGKHKALVTLDTWLKVQSRQKGSAKAPTRKDLNADFPLRGFVTCADCGKPYTACWSKGRSATYPYYTCDTRGCTSYRKSVRRELIEGEFEEILFALRPSEGLFNLAFKMFSDLWEAKAASVQNQAAHLRLELSATGKKIDQLLERIVEATSVSVIAAYERKVTELETQKAVLADRIANSGKPLRTFRDTYRTAFDFLGNPSKLWASPRIEDRRAVLKLVFAEKLPYARGEGYRTAKISTPFKMLEGINMSEKEMVPPAGLEPARLATEDFESSASTIPPEGHGKGL